METKDRKRKRHDDNPKKAAKKVIDETKKRTEASVKKYCEDVVKHVDMWKERLQTIRKLKPAPIVINWDAKDEEDSEKSELIKLVVPQSDALDEQLRLAERESLYWIDVLKEIELWITLHVPPADVTAFGTKIQNETLMFVSCFVVFVNEAVYSTGAMYYRKISEIEASHDKSKYPASYNNLLEAEYRRQWAQLEYGYNSLIHKGMLLYQWLRDREEKLRQPRDLVEM